MKIIIDRGVLRDGRPPETLDMTPDGRFLDPPGIPLSTRILRAAILISVLAAGAAVAALALWFALLLIPIAFGAALIGYAAWRYQLWRRRNG